jgi:hypothetical protein
MMTSLSVTEVTPNLRLHVLREFTRRLFVSWDGAASPVMRTCCGRCDLDSEGDNEGACCQSRLLTRIMVRTEVSQRRSKLEAADSDCVLGVLGRFAAPHILADERDRSERGGVAVVLVPNAQGCGLVRVLAVGRGVARMAPKLAQQLGVLTDCQRKRD